MYDAAISYLISFQSYKDFDFLNNYYAAFWEWYLDDMTEIDCIYISLHITASKFHGRVYWFSLENILIVLFWFFFN